MPYVHRDQEGRILSLHAEATNDATEYLEQDHPDLLSFLSDGEGEEKEGEKVEQIVQELAQSDLDMIRVLEDLIRVLIDKRVLVMTDLPAAAQKKLSRRIGLRSTMGDLGGIINEHEDIMLP